MKTSSSRAVGYLTVAAMLPYLGIKTAWVLGSDVGVTQPGLMHTPTFVVANLLTAVAEVLAAALALALVHPWGRRLPVWSVLFPMWAASGLLAPVMLAAPLGSVAELLAGTAGGTGDGGSGSGLHGWVYAVVYTGFVLQGTGLAVAFALHVRTRWGTMLAARVDPADPPSPTHGVQALATVAVGVLTAVVFAVRLYWALGGDAGLPGAAADRGLPLQALDAASAGLALIGLLGLAALVARRPPGLRAWLPLTAAWVGTGSMFCSGAYQLLVLLAPSTPFDSTGGGGFGLVMVAQTLAGLLAATTAAFHLAETAARNSLRPENSRDGSRVLRHVRQ